MLRANHGLNIQKIRAEFPVLQKKINGKRLIYLDSAATSQKPSRILDRLHKIYTEEYAKPNESHTLSQRATEQITEARKKMASFINAPNEKTIVFNRGCTEGINMVAGGFERGLLKEGDEILLPLWNTMRTLFPGKWLANKPVQALKLSR
ncbi:MAG TPA: aminotransferase class V-fold PLP-dependent enzyme [Flavisolibacter sp.]|nr:aminotransferase class V-fold PLP-dependent enzyme [Flavisolibacter sp.]